MGLKLVTAPASYPITVEQAKQNLRVSHSDEDSIIQRMIADATDYVEQWLGRALIDQTWDLYLDAFPSSSAAEPNTVNLPKPPLISVIGVFYNDADGNEQEFDAANYVVDATSEPGRVSLVSAGSWPTIQTGGNSAVRIRFRAGYLDTASPAEAAVPPSIVNAIHQYVATFYANREVYAVGVSASMLPWGAEQMLRLQRFDKSFA